MRLSRVAISQFRSIDSLTVELTPSCIVLLGINETGKTNILHALALLSPERAVAPDDVRQLGANEEQGHESQVWFIFTTDADDRQAITDRVAHAIGGELAELGIAVDGDERTLDQLVADTCNEGLYCVDVAEDRRYESVWHFEKDLTLADDWFVPDCTSAKHFGQQGAFVKRRFMVLA